MSYSLVWISTHFSVQTMWLDLQDFHYNTSTRPQKYLFQPCVVSFYHTLVSRLHNVSLLTPTTCASTLVLFPFIISWLYPTMTERILQSGKIVCWISVFSWGCNGRERERGGLVLGVVWIDIRVEVWTVADEPKPHMKRDPCQGFLLPITRA